MELGGKINLLNETLDILLPTNFKLSQIYRRFNIKIVMF